ncbi:Clavaminate synthase-like protein [Annulohypoxylon maeteangense]|uniref:Clavaminate synthase-like protein n=1 Tax=Annulohypoxylon maeteangense TaxID=1927788 RepID=UPI002007BD22|nr:Clavaminate synthase-like protein [Annulohypoxylon maeteangense]KAI0884807.1 Clavaminate synthase-like protein [Annulohypoxylon maeteangense]
MSPSTITAEASFTITPMVKSPKDKHDFGAVVTDLDLNDITDADVRHLSDAIWTHKVVVVKGQKDLAPIKQWELVTRFDPDSPQVHSHGDVKTFNSKGGLLSKSREVVGIPGAENVRLIGKGFQGEDHYGIKNMTITKPLSHDWHGKELPEEEFNAGNVRFQRWHMDAPLYARDPAWFTTLRCIKRPTEPEVNVRWDDGSGHSMKVEPGLTAFISNVQMYDMMTEDEKSMADNSWVEYAPHPYMWIGDCKGNSNGLGLVNQGKEKKLEDLGDFDLKDVKTYPMVWINPVTGEKAFQVHGICVRKLFLRSSPEEELRVIEDVAEIRQLLKTIQERVLKPEYILIPSLEEGDIVMWANYQMFHTAIDYPASYGPRTMHQANIASSTPPVGPNPITGMA